MDEEKPLNHGGGSIVRMLGERPSRSKGKRTGREGSKTGPGGGSWTVKTEEEGGSREGKAGLPF